MSDDRELKNAMLRAKAAVENAQNNPMGNAVPQMPFQQAQQNYPTIEIELGLEDVPLPSRGIVYSKDSPLYLAETIPIRGMTATEENILMNKTYIRRGTVITELIKSCLVEKSVDVNSLIAGDRNALMFAIRILGYGKDYNAKVKCPECDVSKEIDIDLTKLPLKFLDPEKLKQVNDGENAFLFTLPITKKQLVFKFLTGKEEEQILAELEAKKKKGLLNENPVTAALFNSIISVEGITDRSIISKFVANMPARDSVAFRKYKEEVEPGIEMTTDFTCDNCEYSEVISFGLGPSFFWPGA